MGTPELTLEPAVPLRSVRSVFAVKAAALLVIFVVYWFIELLVSPFENGLTISLTILGALLPTVAVLALRRSESLVLVRLSLAIDVLALSVGVHLGGGVDNVSLPLLYPAIITLAGLLLTRADTLALATLSAASYAAVVYLEYAGILQHLVAYSRPPARQIGTVIPVSSFLFIYAWLLSSAMEKMRALYRHTEEIRREAMQTLSHDLKNPLSVIYGYARMLKTAAPEKREVLGRGIERSAQEALDLVSNVLDAAAFEGRPLEPRLNPIELNELVGDIADRYRHTAEAARVTLTTELSEAAPVANLDGQLVARALGNLISNAIKYSGANGRVLVSTAARDGELAIRVVDSGPGIAADELPLLFRAYSRTSSARGVEGSGLGLYIVRCIAEAHAGRIDVESTPGQGSTFTLTLPAEPRR